MTDPLPPATVEDLCAATGLSRPSVVKGIKAGQLPGGIVGGRIVITRQAFDAYCAAGRWPIAGRPIPAESTPLNPIVRLSRQTA